MPYRERPPLKSRWAFSFKIVLASNASFGYTFLMNFTKGLVLLSFVLNLILSSSCATHTSSTLPPAIQSLPKTSFSPHDYAIQRMLDAGIQKSFVDVIQSQSLSFDEKNSSLREKIIFLNIFGFLTKSDYATHYSARAVRKSREFIKKYSKTLALAEKQCHVSKEAIAALLWVETKFGKHTGSIPLIQVYFDLLQAAHPGIAQRTMLELDGRKSIALQSNPTYTERSLEEKVIERSIKKSAWALDQLKSVEKMNQKGVKNLFKIKASYAGAFGIPQFIPTTYLEHASSAAGSSTLPDLYNMRDAIYSVAHFLKDYGWDEMKVESQTTALYEYNRAKGYGEVILKLAASLK